MNQHHVEDKTTVAILRRSIYLLLVSCGLAGIFLLLYAAKLVLF